MISNVLVNIISHSNLEQQLLSIPVNSRTPKNVKLYFLACLSLAMLFDRKFIDVLKSEKRALEPSCLTPNRTNASAMG